jgi:hypothetical protein
MMEHKYPKSVAAARAHAIARHAFGKAVAEAIPLGQRGNDDIAKELASELGITPAKVFEIRKNYLKWGAA